MQRVSKSIRGAVIAVAFAPLVLFAPAEAIDKPASINSITFDILRKGNEIGYHTVSFGERDDGAFTADIEAKIRVKVAFITAFKLDFAAHEVWRDGELIALQSQTKRKKLGNKHENEVDVAANGDHLLVVTEEGVNTAPRDAVPSSFTNSDIWIDGGERDIILLSNTSGMLKPSTLVAGGREVVDLNGQAIDCRYYTIVSRETGETSHEIWVDDEGMVMRIHLITGGGDSIYYEYATV